MRKQFLFSFADISHSTLPGSRNGTVVTISTFTFTAGSPTFDGTGVECKAFHKALKQDVMYPNLQAFTKLTIFCM